jgi:hypothetical protein
VAGHILVPQGATRGPILHKTVSTPNVTHPTRGKWVSADRKERFVASQRHVTGGEAISPLSVIGGCALIYDGGDLNLAH